jgi:hypothetical protein
VFCGKECRVEWYNENVFRKTIAKKVCPSCGKTFLTSKPFTQTYCHPECRKEARNYKARGDKLEYMDEARERMIVIFNANPEPRRREHPITIEEKLRHRGYSLADSEEH